MRTDRIMIRLAAASAAVLALATGASAQQRPVECDEACLIQAGRDFLAAVAAHDASLLDWNSYARWTLNGVELPFSEAVWGLENEVADAHQIIVPDPETGNIGLITTWTFDGTPALMAARLKVEWGRISLAEMIVVNQPGPPPAPPGTPAQAAPEGPQFAELGAVASAFTETVAQPAPRAALIASANRYFGALASGSDGPVSADCTRMENGWEVERCTGPGHFPAVDVSPRRYAAVDPARGLVFAIVRLNEDGVEARTAPGSTLAGYLLKIDNGAVTAVEAVGEAVHYLVPTGWEGD